MDEAIPVLVVDDDRDFADSLVEVLDAAGHPVRSAGSAREAEALLAAEPLEVVLVDARLGTDDGIDLIARFREHWPDRLFVAMTAYASIDAALQAMKSGAYDFLRKPFHPDELMATLNRAFDRLRLVRAQQRSRRALSDSERRFRDITEGSVQGVYIHRDWTPLYVNPAFATMLGFGSVDALLESGSLEQFVVAEEREAVLAMLRRCLDGSSRSERCDYQGVRRDGTRISLQGFARAVPWDGGRAVQFAVVDVTEERHALRRLRLQEQMIASTSDLMAFVRADGRIEAVNEAWQRAFDLDLDQCVGAALRDMHPALDTGSPFDKAFQDCVTGREGHVKAWFQMPGDRRRFMDIILRPFRGSEDERGVVLAWRDLTETRDLSEKLSYQATHDGLTGVWNRRAFEEKLAMAVEEAASGDVMHALCYLDLDQFKVVNDTCGHLAGDELLRQIGALLPRKVRRDDIFARLGGDEFAVLMQNCPMAQAVRAATALLEAISDFRFNWDGNSFTISASIGLVHIDRHASSITTVMSRADRACYAAKESGRSRLHVYRADDEHLARRHGEMRWVARVSRAIEESRFELWAQPIRPAADDVDDDDPGHHEILLRLRGDDGEVIPPGAFLPAAERYQLATRIDEWVFNSVVSWAKENAAQLPALGRLFINLSGHSLANDDLLRHMMERLSEGDVPGEFLGFEVTETAAIANLAQAERFISALHERGSCFALDDFGSGLSSFGYLKTLPVDYLKIDGMFVKDILRDPIDLAMVRSINEIGHIMGKRTVAEFVESEAVLQRLRDIGVDYVQGYCIGMPAPLSELTARRSREVHSHSA